MRVKKILMRVKTILMYFRKNTADNLTFNVELVELVNGDLEVVVKVVEVQKEVQDVVVCSSRRSAGRCRGSARRSKTPEAGALKTPVSK